MEPFLVVIGISLVINVIFISGAILYTMTLKPNKDTPNFDPRNSLTPSNVSSYDAARRHSSHPQVVIYHTLMRNSISSAQNSPGFWQGVACCNKK